MLNAKMVLEVAQAMLKVVEDMKTLGKSIQMVCDIVVECLSTEQLKVIDVQATESEEAIPLERVRGELAKKSQAGFTTEVKEIIRKHGAVKLSELDPKEYKAVLAEAEGLGNG